MWQHCKQRGFLPSGVVGCHCAGGQFPERHQFHQAGTDADERRECFAVRHQHVCVRLLVPVSWYVGDVHACAAVVSDSAGVAQYGSSCPPTMPLGADVAAKCMDEFIHDVFLFDFVREPVGADDDVRPTIGFGLGEGACGAGVQQVAPKAFPGIAFGAEEVAQGGVDVVLAAGVGDEAW